MSEPRYKFVELSVVTEDSLEECVNKWVREGWELDAIRFVTGEHSRRPSMAFVSFVRKSDDPPPRPRGGGRERTWEGVEPSRVHKVIELGELDLGDSPPLEAEVDWANARSRRRAAPKPQLVTEKRRPRGKKKA